MSSMGKILLLEGIHPGAKDRLEEFGFQVDLEKGSLPSSDLKSRLKDYRAVGIRSKTQLTEAVLSEQNNLDVIGAFCIGTNQIDLNFANSRGVPVFNAPYANTRSVAELVISEMIALARHLGDINRAAHEGLWIKSADGNKEVRGKTLGIVGYGHIGSQVSVLAEVMGLRVIYFDVIKKLPMGNAMPKDSLEEVLKEADFVTFHVPETPLTKNMIREAELQLMKRGSYLINASRGTVVDIPALATALRSGHLAGAAVDVFPKEPKNNQEKFESELQGLSNVLLTPHIGGSTEEAQVAIGQEVAESLVRYLTTGSTFGSVNFPQVDVPKATGVHRILNVHKNVPGVLGEINSLVSKHGANILAQYLSTDPRIGYVIFDLENGELDGLGDEISRLKNSIKTRTL